MSRSKRKGPYCDVNLLSNQNDVIYSSSRNSTIMPSFIGKLFYIYNGQRHMKILIKSDMVGFKLGEFASSKKRCIYKNKKNKKKSKK